MYNEALADRVRLVLASWEPFSERKMFGGLAFLIGGNMACGITGDDLMVRTGPKQYESALAKPHVRPMEFTGRPMRGMVWVGPEGQAEGDLERWVALGREFAAALPPKIARR